MAMVKIKVVCSKNFESTRKKQKIYIDR